jgi:hypothetical protein
MVRREHGGALRSSKQPNAKITYVHTLCSLGQFAGGNWVRASTFKSFNFNYIREISLKSFYESNSTDPIHAVHNEAKGPPSMRKLYSRATAVDHQIQRYAS